MWAVAALLGNTPAICRKSYVHPGVIQSYTAGEIDELNPDQTEGDDLRLSEAERAAVSFLRTLTLPAIQAQPA
jgi:DNA topoisomerase-1